MDINEITKGMRVKVEYIPPTQEEIDAHTKLWTNTGWGEEHEQRHITAFVATPTNKHGENYFPVIGTVHRVYKNGQVAIKAESGGYPSLTMDRWTADRIEAI